MKAKLVLAIDKKKVEEKKEEMTDEYMRLIKKFRACKKDGEEFVDISRKLFKLEGKIELMNELF